MQLRSARKKTNQDPSTDAVETLSASSALDETANFDIFELSTEENKADIESAILSFSKKVSQKLKEEKEKRPPNVGLKFSICLNVFLHKYSDERKRLISTDVGFRSSTKEIYTLREINKVVKECFHEILTHYDSYVHAGSGWALKYVMNLGLNFSSFQMVRGGCSHAPPLPKGFGNGVLILKDCPKEKCFVYAVAASLLKLKRNPNRAKNKNYKKLIETFPKLEKFPVSFADVSHFEKQSGCLSIFIYGFEKTAFLLRKPKEANKKYKIHLLFHKKHFYPVKSLSSLVRNSHLVNTRKIYVCENCLSYFCKLDKYSLHLKICKGEGPKLEFPKEGESILTFYNYSHMVPAQFLIFCDLEALVSKAEQINDKKLISSRKHIPISVGAVTICPPNSEFHGNPFIYTGKDCIKKLLLFLEEEIKRIDNILLHVNKPLKMSKEDELKFNNQNNCEMCRVSFNSVEKVRDHCHLSGKFRFALCNRCNLTYAKTKFRVNIFFHGLSNYDSHFLVQEIHEIMNNCSRVKIIPKSREKFLAFSVENVIFKDSYQFLASPLVQLASNLVTKGREYFNCVDHFVKDEVRKKFFFQKGIYPYSYMDSIEKLEEKCLPPIECFKNDLTEDDLSQEDYDHAQNVWKALKCETMKDYMENYLLCDVLLLADVFQNFRNNSLCDYGLDPTFYFSTPHFTLDAFLKKSNVSLDLILDVNQYLFMKKGIRGGLSMVSKRYSRANNPELGHLYNPNLPTKYILYLDANNLYGKAMMSSLPVGDFNWMSENELNLDFICGLEDEGDVGCIVECDLFYPEHLHYLHQDYPLAPEKRRIPYKSLSPVAKNICDKHNLKSSVRTEKLMSTFEEKKEYVLHFRTLKLYVELGIQVKKIYKGVKFTQSPIIKSYIDFNSEKRALSTNSFDSNYYKLLSNSLFGKTIERPENRLRVVLTSDPKKYQKVVGSSCFKESKIINEHLVSSTLGYPAVKVQKPFYIGMTTLELAKVHMYNFHYNVMKKTFGKNLQLLYTDTDSLLYEITDSNMNEKLRELNDFFDFSNYPKCHKLYNPKGKKIPGLFKDETAGEPILEFVGLRSKMYSFILAKSGGEKLEETKTAKGVKKSVIQKQLHHADYLKCLAEEIQFEHQFKHIASKSHSVSTNLQSKISLSPFDDKRYLLNQIDSVPYGSCSKLLNTKLAEGDLLSSKNKKQKIDDGKFQNGGRNKRIQETTKEKV